MKRRLFNFITVLSLLLCVATVGLWVRSHDAEVVVRIIGRWHIRFGGGMVEIFSGFWTTGDGGPLYLKTAYQLALVPYWLIAFPLVVLTFLLFYVWRKSRPKPNPATAFPVEMDKIKS